jgi:hypothetical protein
VSEHRRARTGRARGKDTGGKMREQQTIKKAINPLTDIQGF